MRRRVIIIIIIIKKRSFILVVIHVTNERINKASYRIVITFLTSSCSVRTVPFACDDDVNDDDSLEGNQSNQSPTIYYGCILSPSFFERFFSKSLSSQGRRTLSLSLSVSSPLRRTRRRTSLSLILYSPLSRSRWTKRVSQHHQRFFIKNGRLERQREKNTIIIIQTRRGKKRGWWFRRVARESGGEERARVERQGPTPGREHQLRHADDDS